MQADIILEAENGSVMFERKTHEWMTNDGKPPPNRPVCGYTKDKCQGMVIGVIFGLWQNN